MIKIINYQLFKLTSSRLSIRSPFSSCFAPAASRRHLHSGESSTKSTINIPRFTCFFSLAEMRNKLASAEALNGYLRSQVLRQQLSAPSSNRFDIANCRAFSSLSKGESSWKGLNEMWSVACSDDSLSTIARSTSDDGDQDMGIEWAAGIVRVMSSYGKSI